MGLKSNNWFQSKLAQHKIVAKILTVPVLGIAALDMYVKEKLVHRRGHAMGFVNPHRMFKVVIPEMDTSVLRVIFATLVLIDASQIRELYIGGTLAFASEKSLCENQPHSDYRLHCDEDRHMYYYIRCDYYWQGQWMDPGWYYSCQSYFNGVYTNEHVRCGRG